MEGVFDRFRRLYGVKPHLVLTAGGRWSCRGQREIGIGGSPTEAHRNWRERVETRKSVELRKILWVRQSRW